MLTETGLRHMLDNVFNHVSETDDDHEYWWAPAHDKSGWVVVWLDESGSLETLHSYRYPPLVWGGLDTYPIELTGPARV